jgi:hypothetical protein
MKRLAVLAGLATLALATPSQAACPAWDTACIQREQAQTPPGQQGWPKEMPAECTGYGAANTKPAHCAQWEGWKPGQPPPGQQGTGTWQPPPGQQPPPGTGTWQPPPGQQQPPPGTGTWTPPPGQQQPPPSTTWTPDQVMCPANSVWDVQAQRCLFKKADTTTTQRCQPGWIWVTYGNRGKCVKRRVTESTSCQPGWIYSRRLYKCVPGFAPGTPGTQQESGRRICGYGKVWSDRFYRCVPFRTGGGTDGGQQGGYNCGPYERWSNSRQTCVPRRGGGGDTYGSGGSTYGGSQGIPGINIYIGGGKKKRGGDDYGNRGGGGDYGNRGGSGDYGYRGSGGNDYRGRGR